MKKRANKGGAAGGGGMPDINAMMRNMGMPAMDMGGGNQADDANEIANILKEAGVGNVKEQNEDDIMAELGYGPKKKKVQTKTI